MLDNWFILPETGTGEKGDGYKPKYVIDEPEIQGWSGRRTGSGNYIIRVYGSKDALENIKAKGDVRAPSSDKIEEILERITGQKRSKDDWQSSIYVNK